MMNSLEKLATAFLIVWGLGHPMMMIVAPQVVNTFSTTVDMIESGLLGIAICMIALAFWHSENKSARFILRAILGIILGPAMIYGAIVSFAGMMIWTVPFLNQELFQVSIAIADLLAATCMYILVLENHTP